MIAGDDCIEVTCRADEVGRRDRRADGCDGGESWG